ncbi:TPA: hypothetical protein L9114_000448, partial [Klebsiella pneumoniae]|nr:hypothetical protein [Klebsiella pneumoniae]
MTQYNTGYPVPSPAMPDVWDNNETIDSFVNSPEISVTTRTGIVRDTMFGMQKKADEQRIAASVALAEQMDSQESAFNAAQTDKEDRFQGFLNSSGYVFLGNYENGPFQFSARNQYIRYDNQYYRLNAATDVGFTTTGTDATSFANDVTHFVLMDGDTLRQNLGSGEEGVGDALLAVKQPYTGAVARTQHDKNWDSINLLDFVYATDVVDGFVDYGLGLNRAIAAMSSLGSTSVEHIPRRRINLPAGLLHIKTKVELSFGPFAMCGEGIFQTIFA